MIEIVKIGASELSDVTNVLMVQAKGATYDDLEGEDYADLPVFGALGITSRPYPADENEYAEALVDRDYLDGVVIGMRDTRAASIVGLLDPGDSALHSTDAGLNSRILCKGETKTIAAMSRDSSGNDMGLFMSGMDDQIVLTIGDAALLLKKDGEIVLGNGSCQLVLKADGTAWLNGSAILLGASPKLPAGYGIGSESLASASVAITA